MSFISPTFLFALFALAIPIAIHLFNFRKYKTIYFSNVAFLQNLKQQTDKQSQLRNFLVLLARILALTCLIFAFSQPFIPVEKAQFSNSSNVSIFVDNSFSMGAVNKQGVLLDNAKKTAIEIAKFYQNTDHFQLLTNDFKGAHQELVNKDEFIKLVNEVELSSSSKTLSQITLRQSEGLKLSSASNEPTGRTAYIISDFQKSMVDIEEVNNDSTINFTLVPLKANKQNNIYIDSCWFENPVQQFNVVEKLHVRIKNNSKENILDNSIKLFINESQTTPSSFSVDAQSETEVVFSFSTSESIKNQGNQTKLGNWIQNGRIQINDHPVNFDDQLYFNFEIEKNISILCVKENETSKSTKLLAKVFATDSIFIWSDVRIDQLDYSSISKHQLIILNELTTISSGLSQTLQKHITRGGHILVFPSINCDLETYKSFLQPMNVNYYSNIDTSKTRVDKLNLDHRIYKDVFDESKTNSKNTDLPIVFKHFSLSRNNRNNKEYLMRLQNGTPFLTQQNVGGGAIYLSSVALQSQFSNLQQHAIFVPTLHKIGMHSKQRQPLYYTVGNNETIELVNNRRFDKPFHIRNSHSDVDIILSQTVSNGKTNLIENNTISKADNYLISVDDEIIMGIAYNYNGRESQLDCYSGNKLINEITEKGLQSFSLLEETSEGIEEALSQKEKGKPLWKICITLALLFLAMEVVLLRFMK